MGISAAGLRAGKAIIELGLVGEATIAKGLNNLKARAQAIGQSFNKIGTIGGGGVGGGGLAGLRNLFVGSAATAALAWPVKLAAGMQLSAVQLEAFAGSGDVANKMIMDLQQFSAVAFQSLDSLITQTRVLMSRGIGAEEAVADIKAIAAIAAGSTDEFQQLTKAFADVKNATVLTGEEMRQFKNTAFNPLIEISKRTGESMQQLQARLKAGGISFAEVNNALQSSVRSGGLFAGILDKISGTLIGQMKKAFAQFQLSILPLGNALLEPLTNFFKAINGIMPALGAFIKQHIGAAQVILEVAAAIAVGAVAFVTFGLLMSLVSIAATGMAAALGLVVSALGLLLSPEGLAIGLLGALAFKFFQTSQAGATMANDLANYFTGLAEIARQAFRAIGNALAAGDINLAAAVLWAGLKVAWLTGTNSLRELWINFNNSWRNAFVDTLITSIQAWGTFVAKMQSIFLEGKKGVLKAAIGLGGEMEKIGKSQSEKDAIDYLTGLAQQGVDISVSREMGNVATEIFNAVNALETLKTAAHAVVDAKTAADLAAAKAQLEAAKKRFEEAQKIAGFEAFLSDAHKDFFGPGNFMDAVGAGLDKSKTLKPESLFDTRLAAQTFGGNDSIERQSLAELRDINKNTSRGGGLGFI